jgi:hypothetical protein
MATPPLMGLGAPWDNGVRALSCLSPRFFCRNFTKSGLLGLIFIQFIQKAILVILHKNFFVEKRQVKVY